MDLHINIKCVLKYTIEAVQFQNCLRVLWEKIIIPWQGNGFVLCLLILEVNYILNTDMNIYLKFKLETFILNISNSKRQTNRTGCPLAHVKPLLQPSLLPPSSLKALAYFDQFLVHTSKVISYFLLILSP